MPVRYLQLSDSHLHQTVLLNLCVTVANGDNGNDDALFATHFARRKTYQASESSST